MVIVHWDNSSSGSGYMIRVSEKEALRIITSLSAQMINGNCNVEREEFTTKNGEYFSIAVHK